MKTMLSVRDICKDYSVSKNQTQRVLNHINMTVSEGEFVTVMGPSGSGKSTLLYQISGMDRPTSGDVFLADEMITGLSEPELARIRLTQMGFIFQQSNLIKNLNIKDNIIFGAYHAKKFPRRQIDQRAVELMRKTGIDELADQDITQASGGQLQRVAICRALINQPQILFGDEPTGALNSKATNEILAMLTEINREGATIMLVTHDARVALKSDRVIFMNDGMITGEYPLGKDDVPKREERLSKWLAEMGF